MRKIIATLVFATISLTAFSQYNQGKIKQQVDNEPSAIAVAYRLYPTQNMWTFIKLNTRNGEMWQVQYDVQGNDRHEVYLSIVPLASMDNERNDRFALYSTQNIYNFILIDQVDGRLWQVQWSQKSENRGIVPIE